MLLFHFLHDSGICRACLWRWVVYHPSTVWGSPSAPVPPPKRSLRLLRLRFLNARRHSSLCALCQPSPEELPDHPTKTQKNDGGSASADPARPLYVQDRNVDAEHEARGPDGQRGRPRLEVPKHRVDVEEAVVSEPGAVERVRGQVAHLVSRAGPEHGGCGDLDAAMAAGRGGEVAQVQRDLGRPGVAGVDRGLGEVHQHERAPYAHGVVRGLEVDRARHVAQGGEVLGGEEKRVRELVHVGKDGAGQREVGVRRAGPFVRLARRHDQPQGRVQAGGGVRVVREEGRYRVAIGGPVTGWEAEHGGGRGVALAQYDEVAGYANLVTLQGRRGVLAQHANLSAVARVGCHGQGLGLVWRHRGHPKDVGSAVP